MPKNPQFNLAQATAIASSGPISVYPAPNPCGYERLPCLVRAAKTCCRTGQLPSLPALELSRGSSPTNARPRLPLDRPCVRCSNPRGRAGVHTTPPPTPSPWSDCSAAAARPPCRHPQPTRPFPSASDRQHNHRRQDTTVIIKCTSCGKTLRTRGRTRPTQVRCPACGTALIIPPPEQKPDPSKRPKDIHAAPGGPAPTRHVKPGARLRGTRPRPPSPAVGYLVGALVAIPLMFLLIALNAGGLGAPHSAITLVCGTVFFALAHGINRARRLRPSRGNVTPVLEQPETAANHKPQSFEKGEKGLVAGRFNGGQFVVTRSEISAICRNPEDFQNVIAAQEAPEAGILGEGLLKRPVAWYLVLGKGWGVAIRDDAAEVWSVRAGDVRSRMTRGIFQLVAVDGRSQDLIIAQSSLLASWQAATSDGS